MAFKDLTSSNQIKLVIQGIEIPLDVMSGYSYYDAKTYFKEPTRSAGGEIVNLNSYATFFVPRIKFWFNAMPIGAYRILGQLAKQYNEVIVTAYNLLEDTYVTHKMYFATEDFPEIFHIGLDTARLIYKEFELIGTNASVEDLSLIYNSNETEPQTSGLSFTYGYEVAIGDYDEEGDDPTAWTRTGFTLRDWNTASDGSGLTFQTGEITKFTETTTLYAQWQADTNFILSYDYENATSGNTEINKVVIQGNEVGELPTPVKNGYTFGGWFTQLYGAGTEITALTIYSWSNNLTIYAHWIGVSNTLLFDNNGGVGSMSSESIASGESFKLPKCTFTKTGYVFIGWTTDSESIEVEYEDEEIIVMPITNLTLYALYDLAFYLTYDTDGGLNDGFVDFGKIFESAIYTSKIDYSLAGWYEEDTFTTPISFPFIITEDTTIYAKWVAE